MPLIQFDHDTEVLHVQGFALREYLSLPAGMSDPAYWIDWTPQGHFGQPDWGRVYGTAEGEADTPVPQAWSLACEFGQRYSAKYPDRIVRVIGIEKGAPRQDNVTMIGYTSTVYQAGNLLDTVTRWTGPRARSVASMQES